MLSRLFSKHLKIIKIKIADCVEFHIENVQSAKNQTGLIFFSPQNSSVIYNYVFLCYLDCFQSEKSKIADCVEFHIENITIC